MLDTIFGAIEKSGLYEVNSEQKILNYIDGISAGGQPG